MEKWRLRYIQLSRKKNYCAVDLETVRMYAIIGPEYGLWSAGLRCYFCSLLKVHLQLRGYVVFLDIEKLRAGKFDDNLLNSVRNARNFILVLTPNALDRCMGDFEQKDWIHRVSKTAELNIWNVTQNVSSKQSNQLLLCIVD